MPAVSKNFPADRALDLNFQILPVVNSKKQLLGIVERRKLEELFQNSEESENKGHAREETNNVINPIGTGMDQLEAKDRTSFEYFRDFRKMDTGDPTVRNRTQLLHKAGIIAYSPKMLEMVELGIRAAQVDSTVAISGESGVGKELLAKLIHDQSTRGLGQFVQINCGAIPDNLLESELFGYESGAFTGASSQGKMGMFELANGGTLFLDEIGELPLALQVKILRVLQEQQFTRVGGVKPCKVNVRFIAATNRDLEKMVELGQFREDLYFRLHVIPLRIPPLRERREDILPLVHFFQGQFTQKFKVEKKFSAEAMRVFLSYPWPGNVRELENMVERLFVITSEQIIRRCHLPEKLLSPTSRKCIKVSGLMPLREAVDEVQRLLIEEALATYGGNTYEAAMALQVEPASMVKKLAKLREKKQWSGS